MGRGANYWGDSINLAGPQLKGRVILKVGAYKKGKVEGGEIAIKSYQEKWCKKKSGERDEFE